MKKKSISYPSKNLFETKDFVLSIYEAVGDQLPLKYDDMTKYGKVAAREVPYFASTASQYGWTESNYGKGHTVNGEICKILRRPQQGEESPILLNAFTSPEVYQIIIKEWNNKEIQSQDALELFLTRNHGFTDTGAKQCAEVFLVNAKSLGLIDSANYFKVDAEIVISNIDTKTKRVRSGKENGGKTTKQKPNTANSKVEPIQKAEPIQSGIKKIPVFIRSKELLVPVLEDMTPEDWDAFIKQLTYKKNG